MERTIAQIDREILALQEEKSRIERENKAKETNYYRFLNTYSGKELLKKHTLGEVGTWRIFGEDSNCDLGGSHHEPDLGYVKGTLKKVIEYAVELPNFWQWGGGGRIEKTSPAVVTEL